MVLLKAAEEVEVTVDGSSSASQEADPNVAELNRFLAGEGWGEDFSM